MYYEGDEDILSPEQIEELARQGLYPAGTGGQLSARSDSPTEYPELDLSPEDLANLDETENRHSSTGGPIPDPPQPITGPLTYAETLREATKRATGFYPHPWQIAIAWALYYGTRDALVVAGTGYGKTLPFVLNLFLNSAMIVWIVSPLNYIEMEQVKVFTKWGLRAVAVNSMTMRPGLMKEIEAGKFQVIISSIESMTASNKLRPILGSRKLAKWKQLLVLDEAHCVSSWTESGFRPLYAMVGRLRRLLPLGTPALAATATANKEVRAAIQKVLAFRPDPYIANLGNFCSNLIHIVHHLKGAAGAVKEILHYFPSKTDLPVTLIFVNSRAMGQLVLETLQEYVDPSMRGKIHYYHAFRGNFGKAVLAEGFGSEVFRVLICTESLTMGADFRNVTLVINFLCPSTLLTWLQRAGRGACDPNLECRAVLMVQPSLFEKAGTDDASESAEEEVIVEEGAEAQEVEAVGGGEGLGEANNNMGGMVEDQDGEGQLFGDVNHNPNPSSSKTNPREQRMTYTKSILGYIRTPGCRNAFLDKEYDNPNPRTFCTSCDNCLGLSPVTFEPNPVVSDPPDEKVDPTIKPIVWLRPAERESCEARLREWRRQKWASAECADMDITVAYIMPDKVLTAIAKHPCIDSVSDLASTSTIWRFHTRWGHEIMNILQDEQHKRHLKGRESLLKKLVSQIKSRQSAKMREWRAAEKAKARAEKAPEKAQTQSGSPASGSTSKKRKEREEHNMGRQIKVEQMDKRIKQETIDLVGPDDLGGAGGVVPMRKGKGKGKIRQGSNAPQSRAEQLERLAIRLPRPSKSQNPKL